MGNEIPNGQEQDPSEVNKKIGESIAVDYESFFDGIKPELRVALVASNVVLTVAGVKGQTEFFLNLPEDYDDESIDRDIRIINEHYKSSQIFFNVVGSPELEEKEKMKTFMISVDNLKGLERITKNTKIPGVIPYDSSTGLDGLHRWASKNFESVVRAQKEGKIPTDWGIASLMAGLEKGYPDQANFDFSDWLASGSKKEIQEIKIPFTGIYDEAEPNYCAYPENANEISILENTKEAGEVLKGFYKSGWHEKMSQGQLVIDNRRKEE